MRLIGAVLGLFLLVLGSAIALDFVDQPGGAFLRSVVAVALLMWGSQMISAAWDHDHDHRSSW
jgi:ABC-type Mn2+/Zn2+ transport system permease subunit